MKTEVKSIVAVNNPEKVAEKRELDCSERNILFNQKF